MGLEQGEIAAGVAKDIPPLAPAGGGRVDLKFMGQQPLMGVAQRLEIGQVMGQGDRQFVVIQGLVQDLQDDGGLGRIHWGGPDIRSARDRFPQDGR